MRAVTSIRINKDVLNHLRTLNINVSDYINKLIMADLSKKSYEDTALKKVVDSAIREEKKSKIIAEMKVIGAIQNISTQIYNISKNNENTAHNLLKRNMELLELEYENDYSRETKHQIKEMYKEIQDLNIALFEPFEKKKILN
jgi:hypothetical protein